MKRLEDCKKIGVLGGTFNPVHMGHLFMAEYARDVVGLDMVIFMPTGVSYMKQNKEVLPGKIRKEMLDLSIRDNEFFVSSDIELKREGNTYTYETMQTLKQLYPDAELYFLVGADCLFSIEHWVKPQLIFDNCTLIAANRNHMAQDALAQKKLDLEQKYEAKVILLNFPSVDISSTDIRKKLQENKSIRYMVHDAVLKYLQETQLYKKG
ncbi:MAG: nicotinate-nucleotide adenylyltransferase [Lachnospiraceae bacterium]|nr:nicotinate-nucleotide adenylyltransferase [Lachnospiraceae bacterium]